MTEQSHSYAGTKAFSQRLFDHSIEMKTVQEESIERETDVEIKASRSSLISQDGNSIDSESNEFLYPEDSNKKSLAKENRDARESSFVIALNITDSRTLLFQRSTESNCDRSVNENRSGEENGKLDVKQTENYETDSQSEYELGRNYNYRYPEEEIKLMKGCADDMDACESESESESNGSSLSNRCLTLSIGGAEMDMKSSGNSSHRVPTKLFDNRQLSQCRRSLFATSRQSLGGKGFRIGKNPTEMRKQRIEAYFYNHGTEMVVGILYVSVNLLVAAWGAYQFSDQGGWSTTDTVLRVTLPIARAGGRLVTLNCAILLITSCKYLWTVVRKYIVPVIPLGFPVDEVMPKYHSYVALTIIYSGCIIHTLPQIVNYATQAISMDSSRMKGWTLGQGLATKQLLLTGTVLTIIFSTFFFTTRKSFRKTAAGFRWFWKIHMCGVASVYPLLILHGTYNGYPIFLYFDLLPLAMYLFDISMRRKNVFSVKILRWKVHDDDGQQITELVVERPNGFVYSPGQYVELKFASISKSEWHPFTIASAPCEDENSNEILFFIKNVGRWTEALMEYALAFDLSKVKNARKMFIRGPHGAPAMNYFEYTHIMVIGSGVGVTPLLSIWKYLAGKRKASKADDKRKLRRDSMMARKDNMAESTRILDQSIKSFDNGLPSIPISVSSISSLASNSLYSDDANNVFDKPLEEYSESMEKISPKSILLAKILESMPVSICLFGLLVLGLTASILLLLAGHVLHANVLASSLIVVSLSVHGYIVIRWSIAVGGSVYSRFVKFWFEFFIILVDGLALWNSIRGCTMATSKEDSRRYASSFLFFGTIIILQTLRIFHICYLNLKEPQSLHNCNNKNVSDEKKKGRGSDMSSMMTVKDNAEEIHSVKGILVNRKYSSMRFASRFLLPLIIRNGLSDVFSLEFYGTREKQNIEEDDIEKKITGRSLMSSMMGSEKVDADMHSSTYCSDKYQNSLFCPGRPDWNIIFLRAISKAHVSNEGGTSVGVFFCGSPAIAKDLKVKARQVTAQHQFAMSQMHGTRCGCKIIVHSENF